VPRANRLSIPGPVWLTRTDAIAGIFCFDTFATAVAGDTGFFKLGSASACAC